VVRLRVAVVGAALIILSACGGANVTSDRDRPTPGIVATAHSTVDGVETWDLTGEPSDAAFGIDGGKATAIYETEEPRTVRIVLPGRTVKVESDLVDFRRGGSDDYTFRVSTPQLEQEPLTGRFRDVLGQLDLDASPADDLDRKAAAAPADQSEVIEVGVGDDTATLGDWSVAPSATFTPLAKRGRVVLAGTTPPV
jgi:hypothetical protein